jgi:hypothetical protein
MFYIYVYVYVYVDTYIHRYTYIHTHIHICVHIHTYIGRKIDRIPISAIGKNCLIKMNAWGTKNPTELWPGSLKRYLTIYPVEYTGMCYKHMYIYVYMICVYT